MVRGTVSVVLVALVFAGLVPVATGAYQIALAALHGFRNHYGLCRPHFPRTAVLIPAWNEAPVLTTSIDRLMALDYPAEGLRVYVVDDASTDATPEVVHAMSLRYPGRVVHLRREIGGQGKAHTLNHGLAHVLADDWMEALLIMDADVVYRSDSLRLMTRHLADPTIGAVTAYIREGSHPGRYLTRFIGFEYIAAQAAARRGQNVLGALACLAGGAQLHSRDNLTAIGGRIDTSSLAEDTFTTFNTQLTGRRVVFEPHAVVLAEEPEEVAALWRQRLRWARGNLQVTRHYRRLWFRPSREHGLGGVTFGLVWFGLLLQPVLMTVSSASLIGLYVLDPTRSLRVFHVLWVLTALMFLFTTSLVLAIDPHTGRRVWRQALLFPGAVSLFLIVYALFPGPVRWAVERALASVGVTLTPAQIRVLVLFSYAWLAGAMVVAWLAKVVENRPGGRWLTPGLLFLAGYGPLLCAVMAAAYVQQIRRADTRWAKTEKTGKVLAHDV